jgi:gliding motility-associated-like protein
MAITNPWGCVDTNRIVRVRVLDTPVANFYAVDSVKCWSNGSNGFVFNDFSSYPNSSARGWKWYWSDPTAIPNGQNGYTTTGPSTGSVNFTVPGANTNTTHTISLVVTNAFGCTDSIAKPNYITVRDTVPPGSINPKYITVDPLSLRNHVELNWAAVNVSDFLNYEIFRNNTSVATITNSSTTTYNDVIDVVAAGTSQNYKMRVNDICYQGSSFDTTHATINVKINGVATGGYATNNVTFNAYEGWGVQTNLDYYEVYRKKGTNGSYAPVGRVSPVVGNTNYLYVDSGLCADTFYYYVKAFHKNYSDPRLGYYSISNYDSIVANFNIIRTPVEINYVTVDASNQISIQWTQAPLASGVLKNYLVERYDASSPNAVVVYRGTANTCTDNAVNTGTTIYKYVVRYEDQCGNLSNYSDTSVNILASSATQKIANYDAYDMKITWTPYSTWKNGVIRYDIEVKYPNGWRNVGSVPGNTLTFLDVNVPRNEIEGAYCYRVKAIENDATPDSSLSNETCINYPSKILVPSAFTPNGDGLNDTLFINGGGLKTYDFRVYDRWGKCVFQATEITEGWNGRLNNTGDPCQSGIYSYTLIAKGQDFKRYNSKGTITLLK